MNGTISFSKCRYNSCETVPIANQLITVGWAAQENRPNFGTFCLTHYKMTNFRLFQTERVCRQQFHI